MDRNEVLRWLDRMWQHWYQSDERDGITDGPYTTALRAAAELIRAGGWRPIAEAPKGQALVLVGRWHRGEWNWKITWFAGQAAEDGYTHYLPEPEPPAREVAR